jgi:hypothetical protein
VVGLYRKRGGEIVNLALSGNYAQACEPLPTTQDL